MALDASLNAGASVLTGATGVAASSTGLVTSVNGQTGAVVLLTTAQVPTLTALAGLAGVTSAQEGQLFYVQSVKDYFAVQASGAATRAGVRIAVTGLAGFQFVRRPFRNPYWEVQTAFTIDPTNSTGLASDDNTGASSSAPLLTYTELSMRLAHAEINQTTVVTILGDQQAGDNPTWTYNPRGLNLVQLTGSPTTLFTSSVTSYTAAAYIQTTATADDNELVDSAVPGGSWTASGAFATGVLIQRTNGTNIFAPVIKDLGSNTARVAQPVNPASPASLVTFAASDTYKAIKLPKMLSQCFPTSTGANQGTQISLIDWQVPANSSDGTGSINFVTCWIEKVLRATGGGGIGLFGCAVKITGGGSFEGGGLTQWGIQNSCFIGTGASVYSFTGSVNSETTTVTLQGANLLVENGTWNGSQISAFDTTAASVKTGTHGRAHFITTICGKGNSSVLAWADQSSQIVSDVPISTGNFYLAASTSAGSPMQWGSTTGTTQTPGTPPLDVNMNGIFQSG